MGPIESLIRELTKLPGIGEKSAARIAFHLLRGSTQDARALADGIVRLKEKVKLCSICYAPTEADPCAVCSNPKRDHTVILVVEEPQDMLAIEKAGAFKGVYHILHGAISPIDGVGPDDVKIAPLISRIKKDGVKELVIATNPTVSGEATALYISKLAGSAGAKLTRIASGIPCGASIEYIDRATLSRAIEERRKM